MTLIKGNITNGNSDSVELRKRMAEAEKAEKDEEVKTFKETVDSLTDCLEEFTDEFKAYRETMDAYLKQEKKEPEFFDKTMGANVSMAIGKITELIKKLKQEPIDLSPMVDEMKRSNEVVISLFKSLPKQVDNAGYEKLSNSIMLLVESNNSKITEQNNYTQVLEKINMTIESSKPVEWKFTSKKEKYGDLTSTATPIYKK